jgi:hypothetical protein
MKSQLHRRLKNLTATIGSQSNRGYTLEGLCWECWRRGRRGYMALANGDCMYLRVFIDSFKRRESDSPKRRQETGGDAMNRTALDAIGEA